MKSANKPRKPSICACVNVRRASRAITRIYDCALQGSGLKVTQYSLLKNIEARGAINISSLGRIVTLDRTTLVRNLKPLEAAGLIENAPSPDPRERLVNVTEKGRAAVAAALPLWEEAQRQIAHHLGETNLEILGDIVCRLEHLAAPGEEERA